MPFKRIGDITLFRLADVDAWLDSLTGSGTSQEITLDGILEEMGR
jgi:hypothetical protein